MKIFNWCLFIFLIFCVISVLLPKEALSRPRHRTKREVIRHNKALERRKTVHSRKKYEYNGTHDYNKDGVVDIKDRLIWLNRRDANATVLVSAENEDLVEVMDLDKDGDVETWEAKQFHETYDSNENGVLEEEEIEAAVD